MQFEAEPHQSRIGVCCADDAARPLCRVKDVSRCAFDLFYRGTPKHRQAAFCQQTQHCDGPVVSSVSARSQPGTADLDHSNAPSIETEHV
jgi:hypothetical protein